MMTWITYIEIKIMKLQLFYQCRYLKIWPIILGHPPLNQPLWYLSIIEGTYSRGFAVWLRASFRKKFWIWIFYGRNLTKFRSPGLKARGCTKKKRFVKLENGSCIGYWNAWFRACVWNIDLRVCRARVQTWNPVLEIICFSKFLCN